MDQKRKRKRKSSQIRYEPILDISVWLSRSIMDIGEGERHARTKLPARFRLMAGSADFEVLDISHNPVTRMYESLVSALGPLSYFPSLYSLYHGPLDALFKYFWRYLPEPIHVYLPRQIPRREYRRFRNYLGRIREVARGIIRKSIVKGDGRDIMNVHLLANISEDAKTKPPMARSSIRLERFFWQGTIHLSIR
ncbi:hypothetical protein EDB86DRAFT_839317 [Lactarius hatsudake]|nr:hypothetical protein EDB86DRAFT_839317 [Lactarius hatsudake]